MSAVSALRDTGLFSEAFRGRKRAERAVRIQRGSFFRKLCPFRNGVHLVPIQNTVR